MYKTSSTWKIAYADFVTAMMIMFLVLWIRSSIPEEELKTVQKYFQDPTKNTNVIPQYNPNYTVKPLLETNQTHSTQNNLINKSFSNVHQDTSLNHLHESDKTILSNVLQTIQQNNLNNEYKENIQVYWNNGVSIEIFDSYNRELFKPLTSELNPYSLPLLRKIANVLQYQNNYITIDGHATLNPDSTIDPWLLSFTRANKIKQYLEKYLKTSQIIKIIGNSDKDLVYTQNRDHPNNMRITITILNNDALQKKYCNIPKS